MDGEIDGQGVPFLIGDTRLAVSPPLLPSVHGRLGRRDRSRRATMAALHTHLGGTVTFLVRQPQRRARLGSADGLHTVVATATMPAVGFASVIWATHVHGYRSTAVQTASWQGFPRCHEQSTRPQRASGPGAAAPGVSGATGRANLQRIARCRQQGVCPSPRRRRRR